MTELNHVETTTTTSTPTTPKSKRGFASMTVERRREISSKGGRAAQDQGVAHQFTPEEARVAGKKGGEVVGANREHMRAIGKRGGSATAIDREHMREIGRKGGEKTSQNKDHMRRIGRRGGETLAANRDAKAAQARAQNNSYA